MIAKTIDTAEIPHMNAVQCRAKIADLQGVIIKPVAGKPQEAQAAHAVINELIQLLNNRLTELRETPNGSTEAPTDDSPDAERTADDEGGSDQGVHSQADGDSGCGPEGQGQADRRPGQ